MNTFDLHMHSCYSGDGEFTPRELVQFVKEANLKTVALSDHNTPLGIDEMIEEGKKNDILVIPAIEFDTLFHDLEVHVLGYNIDYTLPYFQKIGASLNERKQESLQKRVDKLNAYYHMDLDLKKILEEYGDEHTWQSVVKAILEDPRYKDRPEFKEYQPGGRRSQPAAVNFYWDNCSAGTPCYVFIEYPSLEETVRIIHEAGGIAVLAHPWKNFYQREDRLKDATANGIDGIEAYSNYHEHFHNTYYETYCKLHGLLMTCGSDFHGGTKPNICLGEYGYEKSDGEEILHNFMKAIQK